MTISSTVRKAGPFAGNAVATTFPFAFKVFTKNDIKVLLVDANSVSTTLTLDSDYSVLLNGNQDANPGGSITYPITGSPLIVGNSLVALGSLPNDQETDITNNGGFYPQTIEDMSDRSTIQIQQLAEITSRALVVSEAENGVAALPIAPARAGRALVFDALGAPGVSDSPYTDASTVIDEAIAAANAIVASITTPTFQAYVPLVLLNGRDFTAGTSQSVTLPATLAGKTIAGVFMDGVFQSSTQYTINGAGTLLTFSSIIPGGIGEIDVMYFSPSLLGYFQQDGFGAVAQSFQQKLKARVDAADFGLVADGVTDDYQAMVNAVNSGALLVEFPAANIFMSAKVTLPIGVSIEGKGKFSTTFLRTGATLDYFVCLGGNQIRDVGFNRVGTTAVTGGTVIAIQGSNCEVSSVAIGYCFGGIQIGGVLSIAYLDRINISNYQSYALQVNDGPGDIYLSKFVFNQGTLGAIGVGINIIGNVNVFIARDGEVIGGQSPLVMDAPTLALNACPAFCRFENVFFDSSQTGVRILKTLDAKFTTCWFSSRPGNGCSVVTSDTVNFLGCTFSNNALNGCVVDTTAVRVRFKGCVAVGNSTLTPTVYHGIAISPGTTDFAITDCTFTNTGLPFGQQGYGVYISGGASDRYIVKDNLVSGNATGGVADGGSGSNKSVANNY